MSSLSAVYYAPISSYAVALKPERSGNGRCPERDRVHATFRRFEAGSLAGRDHHSQLPAFFGALRHAGKVLFKGVNKHFRKTA